MPQSSETFAQRAGLVGNVGELVQPDGTVGAITKPTATAPCSGNQNPKMPDNNPAKPFREKIEDAMNSGVEKFVKLKNSVPVIITYYTAWIDENQKLNFRNDVYGNDEAVSAKMFTNTL